MLQCADTVHSQDIQHIKLVLSPTVWIDQHFYSINDSVNHSISNILVIEQHLSLVVGHCIGSKLNIHYLTFWTVRKLHGINCMASVSSSWTIPHNCLHLRSQLLLVKRLFNSFAYLYLISRACMPVSWSALHTGKSQKVRSSKDVNRIKQDFQISGRSDQEWGTVWHGAICAHTLWRMIIFLSLNWTQRAWARVVQGKWRGLLNLRPLR